VGSFSVCLAVHTEDPADGHPPQQGTPSITPNPTSPWDSYLLVIAGGRIQTSGQLCLFLEGAR
jgi:hypothetical protein